MDDNKVEQLWVWLFSKDFGQVSKVDKNGNSTYLSF